MPPDREIVRRLARVESRLAAAIGMLEESRRCDELLEEIAAARSELGTVALVLVEGHVRRCTSVAPQDDDTAWTDALLAPVGRYVRRV